MRALRRILQVFAIVGTLLVGIVAISLIVSQTPWFRDWLRRYVVRESKQYLNGELSIGSLGGNLLFGVQVNDIALDVSGERVVAAKNIEVDYSILEMISKGVVLNEIRLVEPVVRLEKTAEGWNLGQLVKEQAQEADREGPGTPLALESIRIDDGRVLIDDGGQEDGLNLPERIEDLDLRASYEYAPVHYSIVVDRANLRASSPQFALKELTGKIAVRDDNLYVDNLVVRTGESSVTLDGVVENYLETPVAKVTTTGHVSLPEIGRIVPAAAGYDLHPRFTIAATGPAEALEMKVDVQSEAGTVRGDLTADVQAPDLAARGAIELQGLNLAPVLKDPEARTDVTGRAELDVQVAGEPASAPLTDRMTGTFRFTGPTVMAAGYQASDVEVAGEFAPPRIVLNGRAAAYGGSATARGFIVPPADGRELAFELRGTASNLNLQNLPPDTGAPALTTDLSVASYEVSGADGRMTGNATLNRSTVEGATIADGTTARFATGADGVSFGAAGAIASLDLPRIGKALDVPALADPQYAGEINAEFDISGAMPPAGRAPEGTSALSTMTLDATGTLRDSRIMGGVLPQLEFEAHLANGAVQARATGEFTGFNPGAIAARQALEGAVSGRVDLNAAIADVAGPIGPDDVTASGTVTLDRSEIGGLRIDGATVDGSYANQVADLTKLRIDGPDLKVDASGRLALDKSSSSNLSYHVEATSLETLGTLAGQTELTGSAVLDGTVTGNAASLQTTGTLDGSNLGYGENNALDLDTRYTVTIPDLNVAQAQVEASSKATFVKAGGMEINLLTADTTYTGDRLRFTTHVEQEARELDASGEVILHPDHQELHLPELAVRTQGVEWRTANAAQPGDPALKNVATVKYGGDRIELENVRLVSGSQVLEVTGALALNGEAPSGDLKVHAEGVDLAQLETLLLIDRGLAGSLSADATISGTAQSPIVHGRVEIREGAFGSYTYDSLDANIDYRGTRVGVDATLQQSPTEAITVKGTVPTSLFQASETGGHVPPAEGDVVDLQIKSTPIALGLVQGFTTQLTNVTGTLEADVRVTGSGQDPHLQGYVDIKNGAFGVPATGISYTGLDTRLELSEDTISIRKFSITDEEGAPLTVSGELAVHAKEVGAVDISIAADNFELIDNELGDVGVDSDIRITGELRRPVVKGSIRLEAGRLEVDRILALTYDPYAVEGLPPVVSAERTVEESGSALEATEAALRRAQSSAASGGETPTEGTGAAGEAGEEEAGGALDPVALDLNVVIPDNLVLRGNDLRPGGPTGAALGDLNITVGGDLQVVKEAGGELRLLGTVRTIRGTYEFQGRRFDLQREGTVRFMGEPQPNPALDITATRVIPNTGVEARVTIQGTVKAPQLSLSSNPPLEESDILALIVFNRPVNELGTGEKSSLAATAGGIATGFIAAPLGESIGRALDLDLFEITTTTDEGDLGAGLTLGQQIGDRAFFKMRQQFGERNVTEFLLEYRLTDFLRLQTTAAPESTGSANRIGQRRIERAGIDLIFFFSY